MRHMQIFAVILILTSCGSNDSSPVLSTGLKIFVTTEGHVGDFANDPLLSGSNAIEKADAFCNNDPNKPNNSNYKALLVDGINRDALSLTDWVLAPNTTYYRPYNNIEIGQTIGTAIFPVSYQVLTNSISAQRSDVGGIVLTNKTYTGISNTSNYSTDGINCSGWSSTTGLANSGRIYEKNAYSIFANELIACEFIAPLYCVEQQ